MWEQAWFSKTASALAQLDIAHLSKAFHNLSFTLYDGQILTASDRMVIVFMGNGHVACWKMQGLSGAFFNQSNSKINEHEAYMTQGNEFSRYREEK